MVDQVKGTLGDAWRVGWLLALVGLPVAMLLFHVWTQFRITSLGYEVAAQTREHRSLIEERRKLSIEATYQGRSERMLAVAEEQFGLRPLVPEQVIEVAKPEVDGDRRAHAALEMNH